MRPPLATLSYFIAMAIATSISFGHTGCSKEPVVEDLPDDAQPVAEQDQPAVPLPVFDDGQIVVERAPKPEPELVSEFDPEEIAAAAFRYIRVKNKKRRGI